MKKWTKALSAFVVATVMSVGLASAVGCGDDEKPHEHTYKTEWSQGDETGHWHDSTCGHDHSEAEPHLDKINNQTKAETPDGLCDVCERDLGTAPAPVDSTKIKTVDDLIAFRQLGEVTEGDYTLEADIDLAGVTLAAPTVVLSGTATFNGNGHTISNGVYANAESKTGLLFKTLIGSKVTDIKFLNCGVTTSIESAGGLLAGAVESGDKNKKPEDTKTVISKIEFNSCSIVNTNNYAGLLFSRNESATTVEISEITVKNGTSVTCAQYGGLLVGDALGTTAITMKNLDINGEFTASSNGAFLAGRGRGGALTIENAVLKATLNGKAGDNGLFVGGSNKASSLTVKNILIVATNAVSLCKLGSEPASLVSEKIYSVGEAVTLAQSKETATDPKEPIVTEVAENTVATLKTTLGFDFENVWMEEGEGGYRLKSASTNVKSADAKLSSIKVNASNSKLRYKKGVDEFSSDGLLVMGVYSDGVQLVLAKETGYTVDVSGADFNTAGKYKVTVKPVNGEGESAASVDYEIEVVEQKSIKVYHDRMSQVYLVGGKLDTANMSVKSVWSDGLEETLATSAYTVSGFNGAAAGEQTVKVEQTGFTAVEFKVTVLNHVPVAVDGKVYVEVDKSFTKDVDVVKGVAHFKKITDALKYLEYSDLRDDVNKIVYIGEGKFEEHIKTSLKNLTLIGKGKDKTIISASNVQSTVNPLTDSSFGLKENATLIVLGDQFRMLGVQVRNDFDYPNQVKSESSPQGTALMIGGDRSVITDCLLYGHQDTLYFSNGRVYLKDSEIQGNIDFIFGEAKGIAYFENCTIKAINKSATDKGEKNNGYVTAMKADEKTKPDYGYIFSKCTFNDDGHIKDGSMSLGRPWGAKATVAYLECSFTKAYSTLAYGALESDGKTAAKPRWYDMSGNKPQDADFAEWKSTGDGAITTAVDGGRILTDEQAANYTKAKIFAKKNGLCEWTQDWNCDSALTALKGLNTDRVEPDKTSFAIDYVDAEFVEESETVLLEVKKTAQIDISVGPWNSNDKEVTVTVEDPTVVSFERGVLTGLKVGETKLTITKDGFTAEEIPVKVVAPAGEEKFEDVSIKISDAITAGKLTINTTAHNIDNVTLAEGIVLNTTGNATKVTEHKKTVGGIEFTHRVVLKNKGNYFAITAKGSCTVKVYVGNGSSSAGLREIGLYTDAAATTLVAGTTTAGLDKSELKVVEFTVAEAGTYYLESITNELGIYGMDIVYPEVTEKFEDVSLKTSDAITAGKLTINTTAHNIDNVTLAEGIVLNTTGNATKVTEHKKTVGGIEFTHRVVLKNKGNYFAITAKGSCTVKVYVGNGSSSAGLREIGLYTDAAATTLVAGTTTAGLDKSELKVVEFTVAEAGTYYLESITNELGIYGIDVIYS